LLIFLALTGWRADSRVGPPDLYRGQNGPAINMRPELSLS
jgi:hypothetical protein